MWKSKSGNDSLNEGPTNTSSNLNKDMAAIRSGISDTTEHDTVPEIIDILITFYQIKELLQVIKVHKNNIDRYLEMVSKIFNMDIFFEVFSSFCPGISVDVVDKRFIKDFIFSILIVASLLSRIVFRYIVKRLKSKMKSRKKVKTFIKNHLDGRKEIQYLIIG